jgi:hypothetical protein
MHSGGGGGLPSAPRFAIVDKLVQILCNLCIYMQSRQTFKIFPSYAFIAILYKCSTFIIVAQNYTYTTII